MIQGVAKVSNTERGLDVLSEAGQGAKDAVQVFSLSN